MELRDQLEEKQKSTASWFLWVGGLSLVNSAIALSGTQWMFYLGLGICQFGDAFIALDSLPFKILGICLSFGTAALFLLLGWLGRQTTIAFAFGTALYALDLLVFLIAQEWVAVVVHAFVLYRVIAGWRECRRIRNDIAVLSTPPVYDTTSSVLTST